MDRERRSAKFHSIRWLYVALLPVQFQLPVHPWISALHQNSTDERRNCVAKSLSCVRPLCGRNDCDAHGEAQNELPVHWLDGRYSTRDEPHRHHDELAQSRAAKLPVEERRFRRRDSIEWFARL